MGFSRQEYWSGLPFPSPGDLPHPGIKPMSPMLQLIQFSMIIRQNIRYFYKVFPGSRKSKLCIIPSSLVHYSELSLFFKIGKILKLSWFDSELGTTLSLNGRICPRPSTLNIRNTKAYYSVFISSDFLMINPAPQNIIGKGTNSELSHSRWERTIKMK